MPNDSIVAPEGTPTAAPPAAIVEGQSWLLSMPEDLQNDPTLNNYKSVEDVARGFIETKRMVGDRVKIPDDTTPQEEREKFFIKLGRPETIDGYELSTVDMPQTIPIEEAAVSGFKKKALELGLTKKQADGIYVDYLNNLKETHSKIIKDYETSVNQQIEVLKERWGDKFEANRNLAINAFKHFAPPALQATVEREGWGNHPDFVELFQRIGVATSEDVMRGGGQVSFTSLDQKIKDIDMRIGQMDQGDPEYKAVLEQRRSLYEERYQEKPE